MRFATWNCSRGPWTAKVPRVQALNADITVIQECARPERESEHCLWFGDNPRQGIAVVAKEPYKLRRLPEIDGAPKFIVPVAVSGPTDFVVLAVWSKGRQRYRYVEAVVEAVHLYRTLLSRGNAVLIGDLNSNVLWDSTHPKSHNHTALVELLAGLGMESAYHACFGEKHGAESQPTYYFQWNEKRPYHIDYCFLPRAWVNASLRVEIGNYDDWKLASDHRPLVVDFETHPD